MARRRERIRPQPEGCRLPRDARQRRAHRHDLGRRAVEILAGKEARTPRDATPSNRFPVTACPRCLIFWQGRAEIFCKLDARSVLEDRGRSAIRREAPAYIHRLFAYVVARIVTAHQ